MARIAVVTTDVVGARMAGPAIRAWHLAAALASEHDVRLASTTSCSIAGDRFRTETVNGPGDMGGLEAWCDVFIFQGSVLDAFPALARSEKVMVVDVYDPIHLEQLEQTRDADPEERGRVVRHAVEVLNDQLLRGDFFLCASAKQRDLWLGHLSALGRVNPATYDEDGSLAGRLVIVPFGLPDEPPVASGPAMRGVVPGIGADDDVLLWGGGIYNWFDPLTLIRAIDRLRVRRPTVRLVFLGVNHPHVPLMRMATDARALSDELGLTDAHVFFNQEWVPYERRQDYLLEADVGVSTHVEHLETEFSFRTRILDYLWAGLPIVTTQGDSFAELVERRQLGRTVPPEDPDALAEVLFSLLDDAELRATCSKNAASLAPEYAWDRVLQPLLEFCRHPSVAPDRADTTIAPFLDRSRAALVPRKGVRGDVAIAIEHFRHGGLRRVLSKAASRVRHVTRSRAEGRRR